MAGGTSVPGEIWVELHERGGCVLEVSKGTYDVYPGLTGEQIHRQFPDLVVARPIGPSGWWQKRRSETSEEAHLRAERVARKLLRRFGGGGGTIAIVSHCELLKYLIGILVRRPTTSEPWVEELENGSVSSLRLNAGEPEVLALNSGLHLTDSGKVI